MSYDLHDNFLLFIQLIHPAFLMHYFIVSKFLLVRSFVPNSLKISFAKAIYLSL